MTSPRQIFISYARVDKEQKEIIFDLLVNNLDLGEYKPWKDDMIPAGQYEKTIEHEIRNSDFYILLISKSFTTSDFIKNNELPLILEESKKGKILIPVILADFSRDELTKTIPSISEYQFFPIKQENLSLFKNNELAISSLTTDLLKSFSKEPNKRTLKNYLKFVGTISGIILIALAAIFFIKPPTEQNISIRVFDWKKNPITHGNVKLYLQEYIRNQSIDDMGQALFTSIPSGILKNKMKIEVSSLGYTTKIFDTLIQSSTPLELTLPFTTVVFISGIIKTAAEIPIRGVEIVVEGTRYYDTSKSDGGYKIRLEEYTLGDDITIITSHPAYEDKLFSLKIISPEMEKVNIFLNPNNH